VLLLVNSFGAKADENVHNMQEHHLTKSSDVSFANFSISIGENITPQMLVLYGLSEVRLLHPSYQNFRVQSVFYVIKS